MTMPTSRALVGAALAFTVALFVFGSALARALATDTLTGESPGGGPIPDSAAAGPDVDRPLSMDALMLAVENDPFHPQRTRPPGRYRLPGDVDPPPPPPPPPPPMLPDFRVTGTAVMPEGGFAVLRLGDGPPRVLAVGEYLAGYQLDRVTPETATMRNDERELTLLIPGPSERVAAAPPQRAPARGGQQQGRQAPPNPREQAAQAQMMEAMLERARAGGASPQMLQSLQRMIEQRGAENMGNMEIQVQGGTMTVRTRTVPDTSSTSRPPRP